ncbi:unnamed protein product [Dicrocoelium dendriticum]|nr:unnamed protein product [Dicrocoelium dendriticum]
MCSALVTDNFLGSISPWITAHVNISCRLWTHNDMNAVVILCHFCEQHGPSVIMCTQPYSQGPTKLASASTGPEQRISDRASMKRTASHTGLHGTTGSGDSSVDVSSSRFPFGSDLSQVNKKTSPAASQQLLPSKTATCRACSFSTRDEPGFVSQDQAANLSYISTQWPKDPDLLNFVRTACQRSLSCEVSPGPEGAFYFGDEVNGHVVSYNFQIKDSQARGFQSRYCFLMLSWDRVYLLNLWPFLISNFSKMASRIMQSADRVYASESSSSNSASIGAVASGSGTSRPMSTIPAGRGATPPAFYTQPISAGLISVGVPVTGGPSARQRRAVDADMRSLADLTKDGQIFYRIHAWFTWLLRAGARRWTALPSFTAPADEDLLIEIEERQTRLALGFDSTTESTSVRPSRSSFSTCHTTPGTAGQSAPPPSANSRMPVGKSLGISDGSVEEETALSLFVLTRLMHSLGAGTFSQVVQHVAVGNQLVVQPLDNNLLGCLVVNAVSKLLPRGCLKQILLSSEYFPPFRCNLLSLTVDAAPPDSDWNPGDHVLFLAAFLGQSASQAELAAPDEKFVHSLQVRLCPTIPSAVSNLKSIISSSAGATNPSLVNINAPVSTYVTRVLSLLSIQPPLPPSTLDLALSALRQEWINRAHLLYSFKRCQGSILSGEETTKRWAGVLAAIHCSTPENASVARFWQGSLSQYSRKNTCHSRRHASSSAHMSRRGSCCSSNADLTAAMTVTSLTD